MTDQQSQAGDSPDQRSLVAAFVGQVSTTRAGVTPGADGGRGTGVKVLAAIGVTVLVGGIVLGAGYLTRTHGKRQDAAPRATNASQARAVSFSAVTGYGCPSGAAASFTQHGFWRQGLDGFLTEASGGPLSGSCNGSYDAMPMSGSTTQVDPDNYALWTFHTSPVASGVCQISVYVPDNPSIVLVGGDPAVYQVFAAARPTGHPVGAFNVDQRASRGKWINGGSWRVAAGVLTVKLLSLGIDWTSTAQTHAHLAISAISADCSR